MSAYILSLEPTSKWDILGFFFFFGLIYMHTNNKISESPFCLSIILLEYFAAESAKAMPRVFVVMPRASNDVDDVSVAIQEPD